MATTAALAALAKLGADNRQIVAAFRHAQALSGASARRLAELGLNNSTPLRSLITAAVIRRAGPERYYLDEVAWASRRQLRWGTILRIAIVFASAAAVIALVRM